jgi:hypothetical protein
MSNEESSSSGYFLVAYRPLNSPPQQDINQLVDLVASVPGVSVVREPKHPASRHLVVKMSNDVAEQLKERFGDQLMIERDAPLKY